MFKKNQGKDSDYIRGADKMLIKIANQYAAQQLLIRKLRDELKEKRFGIHNDEMMQAHQWIKNHKREKHGNEDFSYNYIFNDNGFVGIECNICKERGLL